MVMNHFRVVSGERHTFMYGERLALVFLELLHCPEWRNADVLEAARDLENKIRLRRGLKTGHIREKSDLFFESGIHASEPIFKAHALHLFEDGHVPLRNHNEQCEVVVATLLQEMIVLLLFCPEPQSINCMAELLSFNF